jgi:hypothetical protein
MSNVPPIIIVVEGTYDVSTICAQAMVKLSNSPMFEDSVTWIQRTEDEPVGLMSERSRPLMQAIHRYEFDIHLRKRVLDKSKENAPPFSLFLLSHLYDVGFWRRASEFGIKPHAVFYVEGKPPKEDVKHISFVRFMHSMDIHDVMFIQNDDTAALHIINTAIDISYAPHVANV